MIQQVKHVDKTPKLKVECIQYRFPNGEQVHAHTFIDFTPERAEKWEKMLRDGCNFASECINGEVTLYIENRGFKVDLAIEIVPNGPEVQAKMEEMLDGYRTDMLDKALCIENDTDDDGHCGKPMCPLCHPENFPPRGGGGTK